MDRSFLGRNRRNMADVSVAYSHSSGGPFGLGLGESRQKFMYLPETQNDFVFAIVCEELGFVGAVTIILLFALLVIRDFYRF